MKEEQKAVRISLLTIATLAGLALPNLGLAPSVPFETNMPVGSSLFGDSRSGESGKGLLVHAYGNIPLGFEANQGQSDASVRFLARAHGYTVFLTEAEAVLVFQKGEDGSTESNSAPASKATRTAHSDLNSLANTMVKVRLLGSRSPVQVSGLDPMPGTVNYFLGNDPEKWRTNVPAYGKVRYREAYPGIDLVYYGNGQRLEFDFIVAPGADPDVIRLGIEGAEQIDIDENGDLVLDMKQGEVMLLSPTVYQSVHGAAREVSGKYILHGKNEIGFQVARYDSAEPLIIDPVLSYSTYLGGSNRQRGDDIAVDDAGNAYVTGWTISSNFPTTQDPLQGALAGSQNAYVTKFDPSGSQLVYSTYIGGSGYDVGTGIAIDSAGNAYMSGGGSSTDFPLANAFQAVNAGNGDGFVVKLNPSGSDLVYSTYLGGSGHEIARRVAVDSTGAAYISGDTSSVDFPISQNPFQAANTGGVEAYVVKLDPTGGRVYSTYLGGTADDFGRTIAVDASGNAYVAGETLSSDFPTRNPRQASLSGTYDFFVTKLNADGSDLVYSTYLGGSGFEWSDNWGGIAVDASGSAYVAAHTTSTDFPLVNPAQAVNRGSYDVFVSKLNPSGTSLVYSTYLGGSGLDEGQALAIDGSGNAYVTGWTLSADFPVLNPIQATQTGTGYEVFVTKLGPAGSLEYSTYIGGSYRDLARGIAVDAAGSVYVTGWTQSTDFPKVNPYQQSMPGSVNAFVFKLIEEGVCGNGVLDPGETCDDGNLLDTDCCSSLCQMLSDGTACSDSNPCTDMDVCTAGSCVGGAPLDCGDGDVCTDDVCNVIIGCVSTNNTAACDDGNACTIGDACGVGVCLSGAPLDCSDGNICTDDVCDVIIGCVHANNIEVCDDGNVCTTGDVCAAGSCAGTGSAPSGAPCADDGNLCTDDICDGIGICAHPSNTVVCDDGSACTTNDVCAAGLCAGTSAVDCDDGNVCTDDICNPLTGGCFSLDNAMACDDNIACNGADTCAGGSCSIHPGDPCVSECQDTCNEATASCFTPTGSACSDDGDPCTVDECDGLGSCAHVTTDWDGDGLCGAGDNCPNTFNPGRENSDCGCWIPDGSGCGSGDSAFDSDGGCLDMGDLCDACPALDNAPVPAPLPCDSMLSGGANAPPDAETTIDLDSGKVVVVVPVGAVDADTSVTVTENVKEFILGNRFGKVYKLALRPEGAAFNKPVKVTFSWADDDDDGKVDGVGINETGLRLKKDGSLIGEKCGHADQIPGGVCEGPGAGAGDVNGDCPDAAAVAARCCDTEANTWQFELCGFSEIFLGSTAGDLIPGRGPLETDCVGEFAVENPQNEPAVGGKGFPKIRQKCTDGDPLCDADGTANGKCVFRVGVCVNLDDDRLRNDTGEVACSASDVATWEVRRPRPDDTDPVKAANAVALRDAMSALGTGTIGGNHQGTILFAPVLAEGDLCTQTLVSFTVPLRVVRGHERRRTETLRIKLRTSPNAVDSKGTKDVDRLRLQCRPVPPQN